MKRILVLPGGSYVSGAEKITLDVIRHLKTQGFELLCCVNGWNNGDFIREVKGTGINFFSVRLGWFYIRKPLWSIDSLINYLPAFIRARRYIRKFNCHYTYISNYKQAVLIYPLLSRNIIYHVHDPNSHSRVNRFFINLLDKKILKYVAVSEFIKKDIQKIGAIDPAKIEVIYNGVDEQQLCAKTSFDKVRIGIIGQLIPRKGHLVLLKAVKLLASNYRHRFVVYVFGTGDKHYTKLVQNYIRENSLDELIVWQGHAEDPTVIYRNIDLTVIPSLAEAFGLVAVESYFNKIPVIASRLGGLEEIVVDDHTGYLFNPGDSEDLKLKIKKYLDDPDLITKMGENGFVYGGSKFKRNTMHQRMELLFKSLDISAVKKDTIAKHDVYNTLIV